MPDKDRHEDEPEFKVVDRRLFTPEGEKREGAEPRAPEPASAPLSSQQTPPDTNKVPHRGEPTSDPHRGEQTADPKRGDLRNEPSAQPQAADAHGAQVPVGHGGPATFEQLVMSLATTAMYQMGLVRNPGEEQPKFDLVGAKESIDLLDILQKKTTGNLTEEEAGLLEGSLYELRMVFVELSKAGRSR
jgi:hypothetical protein